MCKQCYKILHMEGSNDNVRKRAERGVVEDWGCHTYGLSEIVNVLKAKGYSFSATLPAHERQHNIHV